MQAFIKTLYILTIFILLGSACSKNTEPAYLTLSSQKPSQKMFARDSHESESQFNKLIVSILYRDGTPIANVDIANLNSTTTIKVPTQTPLLVTGQGFINNELAYNGQLDVNALSSGQRESIRLILYEINQVNDPIPVDLSIDNKPLSSIGWQFSRDSQYILFSADNDLYVKSLDNQTITNINSDVEGQSVNENSLLQEKFGLGFDISADGYYAVFASSSANFGFEDNNDVSDVFLKNTKNNEIFLISTTVDGLGLTTASIRPHISNDGSRISYLQNAQTLIADNFESSETIILGDLVIYDRFSRTTTSIKERVIDYVLSGDGSSIVYTTTGQNGVFFYDIDNENEIQITDENGKYIFNISQNGQRVLYLSLTDNSPLKLFNAQTSKQSILSDIDGQLNDNTFTNLPAISNDGRYAAFINGNALFVKDTQYNNTLQIHEEISIDSGPFISSEGTKIGYSIDGQVFLLDNPLYVAAQTPLLKANPPSGIIASSLSNRVNIEWNIVDTANYYRIYVSQNNDIVSQLNNVSIPIKFYETRELEFTIGDNLINNETLHFVVTAINDSGEGFYSEEISTTISFDDIPPTILNINPTNAALEVAINSPIMINYDEDIDESSVNQDSISLIDSLENNIPITITHTSDTTTIQPTGKLLNNELYSLTLSTNIADLAGNPLSEAFSSSFTTYAFKNQGSIEVPLDMTTGLPLSFSGEVAANGKSYYHIPGLDINKTYYISLNSTQPETSYSVSSFSFGFTSDFPECSNASDICIVSPIEVGELYLEVDGSKTSRGAEFTISVQEAIAYDGNGALAPLSLEFTSQNNRIPVVINNFNESSNFALFFTPSDTGTLRVTSLNDPSKICLVDTSPLTTTQAICEFPTNFSDLPIIVEYTSSIPTVNLSMTSQEYSEIPINNFPTILTSNQTLDSKYKITGVSPDTFYELNFSSNSGSSLFTVYKDAWQTSTCSDQINGQLIPASCFMQPSQNESVYLSLLSNTPESNSSVNINYIQHFIVESENITDSTFTTQSEYVFYRMSGLEPNKIYQVTVTPEEKFGTGELTDVSSSATDFSCQLQHNSEPVSCEILSDDDGIIEFIYSNDYFFEIGNLLVYLTVLPLEPIALNIDISSADNQISPIKYFTANQLAANESYIVEMIITQQEFEVMTPFLSIPNENWQGDLCHAFFTTGNSHNCVVNANTMGSINIRAADNIPIIGPSDFLPTLADITVKSLTNTIIEAVSGSTITFEVLPEGIFRYQIINLNVGSNYTIKHNSPIILEAYSSNILSSSNQICRSTFTENTNFNMKCDVIDALVEKNAFTIVVNTLAVVDPTSSPAPAPAPLNIEIEETIPLIISQ